MLLKFGMNNLNPEPNNTQKIILFICVSIFLYSLIAVISSAKKSHQPLVTAASNSANESIILSAYISGAIENPGVYEITQYSRVIAMVRASGGFSEEADFGAIHKTLNLSKRVFNEDHIFIPFEEVVKVEAVGSSNAVNNLININTATKSELTTLVGIGPATAEKIISGRPYESNEDILNVSGIGQTTYENIKGSITTH